MATLALSLAGQVVGGAVGGPIGATIGRALGALAGSAIDSALFAPRPEQRPAGGADIRLTGSSEGAPVPRLYGWSRLSGNIVWATELEELTEESAGAKGFGAPEPEAERVIAASFAVALCEGAVSRLGRIWADGQILDTTQITLRFYAGTETQQVDSLIEAKQGAGNAPAYRGVCYVVFERLPLGPFGNRIPNISAELCRAVGELEPEVRAINVIPGAGEFVYDPAPRVRIVSPGVTASENTHLSRAESDWSLSIDELQALFPNLEHVALVVAWFGDDLRCAECAITPRSEGTTRVIEGATWGVAGWTRATAPVVSMHEGGPAYGGTPSDAAVLAAIANLKARGLKVTLYPLILMDVPVDNAMGQPAYPWRGRISCDPAPGEAGSPDGTAAAAAQVAAFVPGYRDFVLHYAGLAAAAGGVDAFIIGSEMRGLSFVRGTGNSFPFVNALVDLAADVRAVLGSETKLTYAADWSEATGYQPGGGENFFHLDPLWASADIDAVGIDNYMPASDWRDGDDHADAADWDRPYDAGYLRANIAGGEGYDWYYASGADRVDGIRSPIADGAYGEPWVWRFKDLVGWWSNDLAVLAGANRIAVETDAGGWEVIGFAEALLLSPGEYRLTRLLRGQMGTAIAAASAGRRVVVLDGRPVLAPVPAAWVGEAVPLRAYAGATDPTGAALVADLDTAALLPLAPVHLRARRDHGTGDVALTWIRRSRADTGSWTPADAPYDNLPEAYRITILDGSTPVRTLEVPAPDAVYAAAAQAADFGGLPTGFGFSVAQISPVYGPGHPAQGTFNA